MFRGLPQYRISLHVFDVDTVAKVTVSQGKSEWSFLLGPAPFCVASLSLICGETQIWLGDLRVALVFGFVFVVCFCFWFNDLPLQRTIRVPVFTVFHCLRNCKDRALVQFRPDQRKKKIEITLPL